MQSSKAYEKAIINSQWNYPFSDNILVDFCACVEVDSSVDCTVLTFCTGMAADVGTLQRLPRVIGSDSLARELVFTARKMMAPEAKECGFVSRVFNDKDR
jgi:hypothetical protein